MRTSRTARPIAISLLLGVLGLLAAEDARAGETRVLVLSEAGAELFAAREGAPNLSPPKGRVAVVCRFDDSAFAVQSLARLAVVDPAGRPVPIVVETESVWEDLGEIVSVRFAFVVDAEALEDPEPFRLEWGPEVTGSFTEVPVLRPDPAARARFFEAGWAVEGERDTGESSIATIEVIADSTADYYSLLYLLPMALLFVLLSVRKLRARDRDPA